MNLDPDTIYELCPVCDGGEYHPNVLCPGCDDQRYIEHDCDRHRELRIKRLLASGHRPQDGFGPRPPDSPKWEHDLAGSPRKIPYIVDRILTIGRLSRGKK